MFFSDQMKEPTGGEDAYFLSFCVIFSECSVSSNGSYNDTSKSLVEAIAKSRIQIEISCPPDGVHNKTLIVLRGSGSYFRIAMKHEDFLVFLSMLNNSTDSKIVRLTIPDPYPSRIPDETLERARDLLDGRAGGVTYPHDQVAIDLLGFGLLFDN